LERSNLFIVPLDEERLWYRYHHLFADLLRIRLQHASPELIPLLHTRASAWFEHNGWVEEAIHHSLTAKDWTNAARLVTQHIPAYLENGKMVTILQWIEDLPPDVIFTNPKLCALVAEVYSQGGMIDKIDPYLDRAEEALQAWVGQGNDTRNGPDWALSPQEVTVIRSMIWILRGLKVEISGDHRGALGLTQRALRDVPEMAPKERAVLHWVEGWAYRSLGCLDDALDRLTRATESEREAGATLRDIWTDLAMTNRSVGKLHTAIEILIGSLQRAANRDIKSQGNLSRAEVFLSLLYLEQNQLDLALAHVNRAIECTQWWPAWPRFCWRAMTWTAVCALSKRLIRIARID
jgi:LuxR family maltose regulon positive regulatory protein